MNEKQALGQAIMESIMDIDSPWEFDEGTWTFRDGALSLRVRKTRVEVLMDGVSLFVFSGKLYANSMIEALGRRKAKIEDIKAASVLGQVKHILSGGSSPAERVRRNRERRGMVN